MLIYNKEWIDNLEVQEQSTHWLKKNRITKDEQLGIFQRYPSGYHQPNLFARIGMFLFTLVIIFGSIFFFNSVFFSRHFLAISIQTIFWGGLFYFAADRFVSMNHYFRSGVIDALIYASVTGVSLGLMLLISGSDYDFSLDPIIYIACALPFLIFVSIRFRDAFLALVAYAGVFALNVLLILKMGTAGKLILPFEGMIFSFIAFMLFKRIEVKEHYRCWKNCVLTVKAAALLTLYLAGNYYVVRELSEMLLGVSIEPGSDIPFAYFFYVYTIAVPLVYIWLGLKQRSYLFIRLGMLLAVAGVLTIRHYYSVMPPETALSLAGIFLMAVAWLSISYLKSPRKGFSYLEDGQDKHEAYDAIGAVIISYATAKSIHTEQGARMGGGSSGGGGAGGEF